MEFAWFVRVCLVRPGTPWRSLDSVGFVGFIEVRFCCRWARFGSSGSSGCALVVVGFVRVCLVRQGAP